MKELFKDEAFMTKLAENEAKNHMFVFCVSAFIYEFFWHDHGLLAYIFVLPASLAVPLITAIPFALGQLCVMFSYYLHDELLYPRLAIVAVLFSYVFMIINWVLPIYLAYKFINLLG